MYDESVTQYIYSSTRLQVTLKELIPCFTVPPGNCSEQL